MKNKEILRAAAELCQKSDVAALFAGKEPENAEAAGEEAAFFRNALLLALWEIADRVAAPVKTERVRSDGFVSYAALSAYPVELLGINGAPPAEGKRALDGFFAPIGQAEVTYSFRLKSVEDEAECPLAEGISPEAAVYYVAAEVYAKEGLSDRSDALAARYERLLFSSAGRKEKPLVGGRSSAKTLPVGRWLP